MNNIPNKQYSVCTYHHHEIIQTQTVHNGGALQPHHIPINLLELCFQQNKLIFFIEQKGLNARIALQVHSNITIS